MPLYIVADHCISDYKDNMPKDNMPNGIALAL
jgi:hypothetical protein